MKRKILLLAVAAAIGLCGFLLRGSPEFFFLHRHWLKVATLAATLLCVALLGLGKGNRSVWLALAVVSILNYCHYGRFHGPRFVHYYDTIHYHLGSKYFDELGYDGLYLGILAAEREGRDRFQEFGFVRDLRSNQPVPIASVQGDIERVRDGFSPARWAQFKADFEFFRGKEPLTRWRTILLDHGFNPSPIWTVTGSALTNGLAGLGLSTQRSVNILAALDPLLLLALTLLVAWSFGLEVACCAVVFLMNNPLVPLEFTGGAYLRQDWLFALVGSICLWARSRHAGAGALLAYGVGTRLFPAVFALFPLLRLAGGWWRSRSAPRAELRFTLGLAGALLALFAVSLAVTGGPSTWATFLQNTREHDSGVYSNHVAYRNAFLFEPGETVADHGRNIVTWSRTKRERFDDLEVPYRVTSLVLAILVLLSFRRSRTLDGICVSGLFVFLLFYPAGYYGNYLLPILLFAARDGRSALAGVFAFELVAGAGTLALANLDEYCAFASAVVAIGGAWLCVRQARRPAAAQTAQPAAPGRGA